MEYWRQCSLWLINCKVLPRNHRVTADSAQVFDLAQTLRDGVLLCQLLNNLRPDTINLKEINLRPQMSQFLCLKNIRTFLSACCEAFGMKKSELFDAFDLFDVRDFGKVIKSKIFFQEFLISNFFEGDQYCCLLEIKQTEAKYTETLETIEKYFMIPLMKFISATEIDKIFINIPDLVKVHKNLLAEIQDSVQNKNAENLHQIFIIYKDRLLLYGKYCSHVESAISLLDFICKEKEGVRLKLEECSKRANNGKFTLRDLLVVPMQRVLKYPLLLQELVKYTSDSTEKSNLRLALDAMRDLAQYVNEVKRDVETLREIDQYQRSIENLNQCLLSYGRPKGDGEVRLVHIFLFDVAVIVCKRRGDNYEMKEVIDLNHFKITNNPTTDKDCRKWCYGFYLTHQQGQSGFEFLFKTKELKKKWLDQFEMAISNIRPENATFNSHHFRMHTFERATSCSSCHMLLRGIFNQGYLCPKCGNGAHKGCLGKLGACGRTWAPGSIKNNKFIDWILRSCFMLGETPSLGLPKMLVIRDYFGVPSPSGGPPLNAQIGDVIEVIYADPHSSWFAGPMERHHAESELMERENSTYLVRYRSRESREYAISIKYGLVEYYKQHSLKEGFRTLDTSLQVPYKELGSGLAPAVLTPRVLGIALARYDFSSRDTRELSLQVGDLVKIYIKCTNGWWKGEVNGQVRKNTLIHHYSLEAQV
uniref:Vav 3 guanine nucleotide exchange factor b n=1 Tax=Sinocyclocheilus rhinocerous TaxID=307959 RepID=A0A673G4C9_9TELE